MVRGVIIVLVAVTCFWRLVLAAEQPARSQLVIQTEEQGGWDLRVAPAIPVAGQEALVRLTVHNQSSAPQDNVGIEIVATHVRDGETVPLLVQGGDTIPASQSKDYSAPWKPAKNGWYRLAATVLRQGAAQAEGLSLIHISEPTRPY